MGNYHDVWRYSILAEDYYKIKRKTSKLYSVETVTKEMIAEIVGHALCYPGMVINDDMNSVSNWDC